jgi:hypothetical protein
MLAIRSNYYLTNIGTLFSIVHCYKIDGKMLRLLASIKVNWPIATKKWPWIGHFNNDHTVYLFSQIF